MKARVFHGGQAVFSRREHRKGLRFSLRGVLQAGKRKLPIRHQRRPRLRQVELHEKNRHRCGWIDLVALKYSIMVNGVTQLIMMKSDVLDDFETIKACVAYKVNGEEIDYFPYDISEGLEPVYAELPGWKTDMTKMTSEDEFPEEFNAYVTFLEEQLETPIKIVSVGPDRDQTIERYTEE